MSYFHSVFDKIKIYNRLASPSLETSAPSPTRDPGSTPHIKCFIIFRVACMYFNYSTTTPAVVSSSLSHCLNVSSLRGYMVSCCYFKLNLQLHKSESILKFSKAIYEIFISFLFAFCANWSFILKQK